MVISFEDAVAHLKQQNDISLFDTVKIHKSQINVKRVKNKFYVTILENVYDKALASHIKKLLSCGGTVNEKGIYLQGNQKQRLLVELDKINLLATD